MEEKIQTQDLYKVFEKIQTVQDTILEEATQPNFLGSMHGNNLDDNPTSSVKSINLEKFKKITQVKDEITFVRNNYPQFKDAFVFNKNFLMPLVHLLEFITLSHVSESGKTHYEKEGYNNVCNGILRDIPSDRINQIHKDKTAKRFRYLLIYALVFIVSCIFAYKVSYYFLILSFIFLITFIVEYDRKVTVTFNNDFDDDRTLLTNEFVQKHSKGSIIKMLFPHNIDLIEKPYINSIWVSYPVEYCGENLKKALVSIALTKEDNYLKNLHTMVGVHIDTLGISNIDYSTVKIEPQDNGIFTALRTDSLVIIPYDAIRSGNYSMENAEEIFNNKYASLNKKTYDSFLKE